MTSKRWLILALMMTFLLTWGMVYLHSAWVTYDEHQLMREGLLHASERTDNSALLIQFWHSLAVVIAGAFFGDRF